MVVGRFEEDLRAWHVMLEVEGIDVIPWSSRIFLNESVLCEAVRASPLQAAGINLPAWALCATPPPPPRTG